MIDQRTPTIRVNNRKDGNLAFVFVCQKVGCGIGQNGGRNNVTPMMFIGVYPTESDGTRCDIGRNAVVPTIAIVKIRRARKRACRVTGRERMFAAVGALRINKIFQRIG